MIAAIVPAHNEERLIGPCLQALQSAARQSKETLRFFRDRGNVLGQFSHRPGGW